MKLILLLLVSVVAFGQVKYNPWTRKLDFTGTGTGNTTTTSGTSARAGVSCSDVTLRYIKTDDSPVSVWACNGTTWVQDLITNPTVAGVLRLYELPSNGSTHIDLGAPDSVTGSYRVNFPAAIGTAGQALVLPTPIGSTPYQLAFASAILKVFSGTQALGVSSIPANSCATTITVTATGTLSTDSVQVTANADINGATGYSYTATDGLKVYWYPTTDAVKINVCNGTGTAIVPGAVTLNVLVTR